MRHAALALTLAGCAASGPEDTLDAYQRAVSKGDWATVHRLSDRATRKAASPEVMAESKVAAWGAPVSRRHEVVLDDGRRVVLVEEDGAWRVASGGVEVARTDTPAASLQTLWWALDHERWDVVRRVLPNAVVQRFDSDSALVAHLAQVRPRIRAARESMGDVVPVARIEGVEAVITYGERRSVRFVLEDGRWRILDVE